MYRQSEDTRRHRDQASPFSVQLHSGSAVRCRSVHSAGTAHSTSTLTYVVHTLTHSEGRRADPRGPVAFHTYIHTYIHTYTEHSRRADAGRNPHPPAGPHPQAQSGLSGHAACVALHARSHHRVTPTAQRLRLFVSVYITLGARVGAPIQPRPNLLARSPRQRRSLGLAARAERHGGGGAHDGPRGEGTPRQRAGCGGAGVILGVLELGEGERADETGVVAPVRRADEPAARRPGHQHQHPARRCAWRWRRAPAAWRAVSRRRA